MAEAESSILVKDSFIGEMTELPRLFTVFANCKWKHNPEIKSHEQAGVDPEPKWQPAPSDMGPDAHSRLICASTLKLRYPPLREYKTARADR